MRDISARLVRSSGVLSGEILGGVAGLVVMVLAASRLGTHEFGTFGIAAAVVSTAVVVLDLRLDEMAANRLTTTMRANRESEHREVFGAYVWADALAGSIRSVVLIGLIPIGTLVYGDELRVPFLILGIGSAFIAPVGTMMHGLNVLGRKRVVAVSRSLPALSRLGLFLVFLPRTAVQLSWIYLGGSVVTLCAMSIFARNYVSGGEALRRARAEWSSHGKTILGLSVSSSLKGMSTNADQLIIGALLSPDHVAVYRVAKGLASPVSMVIGAVRLVEAPAVFSAARDSRADLRDLLTRMSHTFAVIGVGAVIGWLVVGGTVRSWLFPDAYAGVYAVTAILLAATAVEYATGWSKILPAALGDSRPALFDAGWHGLSPWVLSSLATVLFGIVGAASSRLLISVVASTGWAALAIRRTRNTRINR